MLQKLVDTEGRERESPLTLASSDICQLQPIVSTAEPQWWTNSMTPTAKGMSGAAAVTGLVSQSSIAYCEAAQAELLTDRLKSGREDESCRRIGWKAPHHGAVQDIVRAH